MGPNLGAREGRLLAKTQPQPLVKRSVTSPTMSDKDNMGLAA